MIPIQAKDSLTLTAFLAFVLSLMPTQAFVIGPGNHANGIPSYNGRGFKLYQGEIPQDLAGLSTSTNTRKLSYDEIQNVIDVSRPYYKLEDEIQVDITQTMLTNQKNNQEPSLTMRSKPMPFGLYCTVDPEMPVGREQGSPISCAEAGRHMAIAGSIAAALNQPSNKKGKHYYLAMDCLLKDIQGDVKSSLPSISKCLNSLASEDVKNEKIVILAVCHDLTKRGATCDILMQFPNHYGPDDKGKNKQYGLRVHYTVLAPRTFQKVYPPISPKAHWEYYEPRVALSPYAQFKGLPLRSIKVSSLGDSHICMKNFSFQEKIPTSLCTGHFDGNPVFPMAFMAAFCGDLSAEAISALSNRPTPFEQKPSLGQADNDTGLKFISCKGKARKLVQSDTFGIFLFCDVTKEKQGKNHMYSSDVSIITLNSGEENIDDGTIIAKFVLKFLF